MAGLALGPARGPVDVPADLYRPGGMDVREVGRVLGGGTPDARGCLGVGDGDVGTPEQVRIGRLFRILERSGTGRALLRQARYRNVHVCLDRDTDLLAYYFAGVRVIGLSTGLSEGGQIAYLAHELSHVPQHPEYSDNRYFSPQDLILLRRVREAAAEAAATRTAWELRRAGYGDAWQEKTAGSYGDVAAAFEDVISDDASEAGADRAMRAAFDRWFHAPWRLNAYDRMTVAHLERISGDAMGLVPTRRFLSHSFLAGIAWLNGRNYLIESRGRWLTDPYYGGRVSARNARHLRRILWHAVAGSGDRALLYDVAS